MCASLFGTFDSEQYRKSRISELREVSWEYGLNRSDPLRSLPTGPESIKWPRRRRGRKNGSNSACWYSIVQWRFHMGRRTETTGDEASRYLNARLFGGDFIIQLWWRCCRWKENRDGLRRLGGGDEWEILIPLSSWTQTTGLHHSNWLLIGIALDDLRGSVCVSEMLDGALWVVPYHHARMTFLTSTSTDLPNVRDLGWLYPWVWDVWVWIYLGSTTQSFHAS